MIRYQLDGFVNQISSVRSINPSSDDGFDLSQLFEFMFWSMYLGFLLLTNRDHPRYKELGCLIDDSVQCRDGGGVWENGIVTEVTPVVRVKRQHCEDAGAEIFGARRYDIWGEVAPAPAPRNQSRFPVQLLRAINVMRPPTRAMREGGGSAIDRATPPQRSNYQWLSTQCGRLQCARKMLPSRLL